MYCLAVDSRRLTWLSGRKGFVSGTFLSGFTSGSRVLAEEVWGFSAVAGVPAVEPVVSGCTDGTSLPGVAVSSARQVSPSAMPVIFMCWSRWKASTARFVSLS